MITANVYKKKKLKFYSTFSFVLFLSVFSYCKQIIHILSIFINENFFYFEKKRRVINIAKCKKIYHNIQTDRKYC